jgi:hypothetical protein
MLSLSKHVGRPLRSTVRQAQGDTLIYHCCVLTDNVLLAVCEDTDSGIITTAGKQTYIQYPLPFAGIADNQD